jgi:hypothetical protein
MDRHIFLDIILCYQLIRIMVCRCEVETMICRRVVDILTLSHESVARWRPLYLGATVEMLEIHTAIVVFVKCVIIICSRWSVGIHLRRIRFLMQPRVDLDQHL